MYAPHRREPDVAKYWISEAVPDDEYELGDEEHGEGSMSSRV